MHCAPFLLTMQIIFASVSYRRVVADLRVNTNRNEFMGLKNRESFDVANTDAYDLAANCVKKKTYFAMDILFHTNDKYDNWQIPSYIREGLLWLKKD